MAFIRTSPYNQLPFLPPADVELETQAVLKATISAHAALGELRGMGQIIPNQRLILRSMALQEARLSSEIENIVTTSDVLYRAIDDEQARRDPATKEVLRYQDALWHGMDAIVNRPLRTPLFLELVRLLKGEQMELRRIPGTRISDGFGGILYTPPEGEFIIREKLENLETFLETDDGLDPLVKMALAHYQFEAIHPFSDGNGRTGRIINILYLVKMGLLSSPVLYLSKYIIDNKDIYYDGLRNVTENGDWHNWILYMVRGVTKTAIAAVKKITAIRIAMDEFARAMQSSVPRVYSLDLVNLLFQQPCCRIRDLEEAGVAKRETASKYLQELADAGLLKAERVGAQRLFVNLKLLEILESA